MKHCLYLLLFDIDGTLIRSAGAGKKAMERAFETVYSIPEGLRDIHMMGRTDPSILDEAIQIHGIESSQNKKDEFQKLYFRLLEEEIQIERPGKKVCTGIRSLLLNLEQRNDTMIGLLTGNWHRSGMIKLQHFEIDKFFQLGAFADDSPLRNDLAPIAIAKAEKLYGEAISQDHVFVIGDTPLDIQCARPSGVKTVAVATGMHTVDQLAAEKPDYLFKDFGDNKAFIRAVFNHCKN
jgi:phosphoglycolate phosphatase-like HAD superfamily hydrolase